MMCLMIFFPLLETRIGPGLSRYYCEQLEGWVNKGSDEQQVNND